MVVRSAGVVVWVLGLTTLVGWLLDLPGLTGLGDATVPMAPSTALLFAAHGIALGLRARRSPGVRAGLAMAALAGLAGAAALLLLVLSLFGIRSPVEHLGMAIAGEVHGVPVGHMSPVTAAGFLLASLASLLSVRPFPARSSRRVVAGVVAGVLLMAVTVLSVAYLYGTPLLYGAGVIPPALNTTLAFTVLALGQLLAIGRGGTSAAELHRRLRASGWFLVAFVPIAAGMVAAGYGFFRNFERHYQTEVEREISAVADLKVSEIVQWRRERLGDGTLFFGNANFTALVQRRIEAPGDEETREKLAIWMRQLRDSHGYDGYDRVILLDAAGRALASHPSPPEPVAPHLPAAVAECLGGRHVRFLDFHRDTPDGPIHLTVLVPLYAAPAGARPLGVLALRIDPRANLYRIIQRWPTPRQSAETLLVRRDGDEVLFLNDLRFRPDAALSLRKPLSSERLPAAMAVRGQEGIVDGVDYRGVEVVAALRSIPGSP